MRNLLVVPLLSLILAIPLFESHAGEEWNGNSNFGLGAKEMATRDWSPTESQGEFSMQLDFGRNQWPLNMAVDLLTAAAEEYRLGTTTKVTTTTSEFAVGVRKNWDFSGFHPFVGGGVAVVGASVETAGSGICEGNGTGLWFGGGGYFTLSNRYNIGLQYRHTDAKIEAVDIKCDYAATPVKLDADAEHVGLMFGFHW